MAICHKCRRLSNACRCRQPKRQNETQRRWYKTARWARLRMMVGDRDHWLCQECLKQGREEPGNQIDHIKRATERDDLFWEVSNLQVLCQSCHSAKTHAEGPISGGWVNS